MTEAARREARVVLASEASTRLDLVRGVAAVLVCAGHLRSLLLQDSVSMSGQHALLPFYFLTSLGHEAVMVFFVLSGYLVGGAVLRDFFGECFSWRRYIIARITRLWMVVLPALILTVALDRTGLELFGTDGVYAGAPAFGNVLAPGISERLDVRTIIGNALFVQTVLVRPLGSNGALWSLANEAWYYLMFPTALTVVWSGPRLRRVVAAAALAGMVAFVGRGIVWYMLPWLLGAAVAFTHMRAKGAPEPRWSRQLPVTGWAGIVVSLVALKAVRATGFAGDMVISLAAGWWLWTTVRVATLRSLPGAAKSSARFLSEISFSLYATHLPVVVLFAASRGATGRWAPTPTTVGLVLVAIAVMIAFARLVWWCCESRTESLRRWILRSLALGPAGGH